MRILLFIPLVVGGIIDAATFVLWLAIGILNIVLGVIFGFIVVVVKLVPLVPGVALLGGVVYSIYSFGAWAGLGILPIVVLGTVNSGALIRTLHAILRELYIRPLQTFQHQHQSGETGYVTFIATKEEYFSIRRAANLAGIWFSSVKWEPVGVKFVYKVWLREKSG